MTEKNKVTSNEEDVDITCPVCGSNEWKLFTYESSDEYRSIGIMGGFRVACANGCYVDNINWVKEGQTSFDVIREAFKLIEADRSEDIPKLITPKDIAKFYDILKEKEKFLVLLEEGNELSRYGRGELDILRFVIEGMEKVSEGEE
jgi:hypothetical protein